jgi:hypothetical protein
VEIPYPTPTQEQTRRKSGELTAFFLAGAKKGGDKITRAVLAAGGVLPRIILKKYASGAIGFPGRLLSAAA